MTLTIEDIRNPDRISGFSHVGKSTGPNPYQAVVRYQQGLSGSRAVGPRRATAEQSAQDYCDYINGGGATLVSSGVNTAGHKGRRSVLERDEEVEAALGMLRDARAQRAGRQGYVYLIGVEGDDWGVKVGYSVNPEARVPELQTGSPRILRLLATFKGTTADERSLHSRYLCDNLVGEWFRPTPELLSEFDLTEHDYASALNIYERLAV